MDNDPKIDIDNRPVFGLSVREYIALTREVIAEELKKLLFAETRKKDLPDDIIFINEVMQITGYTRYTVYTKVSRFEIPVVSRKKPLTFSRQEIMQWMRDGKPSVVDMKAQKFLFNKKIA